MSKVEEIINKVYQDISVIVNVCTRLNSFLKEELEGTLCGVIIDASGEQWEKLKTSGRLVKYDAFMNFVKKLPKRENIIAKLMYFISLPIEEILDLNIQDVDFQKNTIRCSRGIMQIPSHATQSISSYVGDRKKGRLIINFRGERMQRNHIVNAFARISSIPGQKKITPTMLLKHR